MPWQKSLRLVRRAKGEARDVLVAGGIVAVLLGAMLAFSGGAWPPLVIIESGSMMHVTPAGQRAVDVPYGRIGTIDPGDIHFVRNVGGVSDVELWVQGGKERFGLPGDVVVYRPNGMEDKTPIIHRAITWLEVRGFGSSRSYTLEWLDGTSLVFGPEGIYLPALGIDERNGYSRTEGWRPPHSGFLTKGDNVVTNDRIDQIAGFPGIGTVEPVRPEWVVGVARGELPWFGLTRLVFLNGRVNQVNPDWVRIGNAYAPLDLWSMLFLLMAASFTVPLAIDVRRAWRDRKEAEADLRRGEEDPPARKEPALPPPDAADDEARFEVLRRGRAAAEDPHTP